jgi:hypothetical protein
MGRIQNVIRKQNGGNISTQLANLLPDHFQQPTNNDVGM